MIVVLAMSALILGVLFVGSLDNTAHADSPSRIPHGGYIMITGSISSSTDLVYIIDVPNEKMLVYFVDEVNNNIKIVDDVDLGKVFGTR
jgi:hypothetical protein